MKPLAHMTAGAIIAIVIVIVALAPDLIRQPPRRDTSCAPALVDAGYLYCTFTVSSVVKDWRR